MTQRNYAQLQAEGIIRNRRITAPQGHTLCDREPFAVDLQAGRTVTFTGAEVAQRSGLPILSKDQRRFGIAKVGELSGAVVLAPCHVAAEVSGRSWPKMSKLFAWRVQCLWFIGGDTVRLHAVRDGVLTVWPMVLAEPYRIDTA